MSREPKSEDQHPVEPSIEPGGEDWRLLFLVHPQAIFIFDVETLRFLAVNDAALLQYGWSRAEFEAMTMLELHLPAERKAMQEIIESLRKEPALGHRRSVRTLRHRRKDGAVIEVELSAHSTRFAGRDARVCLVRDASDQRRAERAEKRYHALLEHARDKILFVSLEGKILDCNPAALRSYGYHAEEMVGQPISMLRDPTTVPDITRQLVTADREGLLFETVHRRKDGTRFPVEVSSRGVRIDGERVLVSIIRDISERRHTQAMLHSTEQRLHRMLQDAPLAVLVVDEQGLVDYANPFFLKLAGKEAAEAVGLPAPPGFLPGEPRRAHFQDELVTPFGVRHLSWTHSVLRGRFDEGQGALFLGLDMTEHWHAEAAVRRSERRFRTLIEGNPDAIAVCSGGRITYANQKLQALLGRPEQSYLGVLAEDLVHSDDRALMAACLLHAQKELVEVRLPRPDGTFAYAELASMPIEADGGPAVLLVARDVSDRRQMQARLMQASRVASVGTLAAGVAHEINNPLAYVESNLSFVRSLWPRAAATLRRAQQQQPALAGDLPAAPLDELPAALLDEVSAALDEAGVGVERVRVIVARLKQFARSESDGSRPLDLRAVLDNSLRIVGHELRHRARVVREYQPAPPVLGSEARLSQAFINLLLNAAQAIPEGHARDNVVHVRLETAPDGGALVTISDTGGGIAADVLPRIFDPFFTTRPVGEGAGLGLSIAHGVISGLGGEIDAQSTVGKGTTMRVLLPRATPA